MGKVIERARITNLFDRTKTIEIDTVVDTGATMLVLPRNIVSKPGLEKIEEVKVKYAVGHVKTKEIYYTKSKVARDAND